MSRTATEQAESVHPIDEKLPLPRLFLLGFQHVIAMYAGAVAVPLIVGGALVQAGRFEQSDIHHLIVADLFVAGIASIIQAVGFWRFGARLPLIQGVSFVSVAPMIAIGSAHGVTAIYGAVISTGIAMMLLAPVFSKVVKIFPPIVIGTIIMLIGLTLMTVPAGWIVSDNLSEELSNGLNYFLAILTLAVVIVVHTFAPAAWRSVAVLVGVIVGTIVAALFGVTDFSSAADADWVAIPTPMQFGVPTFHVGAMLTMLIVGLVIMVETTGDIVAVGDLAGRRVNDRQLADGLRADGLSTVLGGIFNTFPYAAFAQNVGLVSLTKVYSRFVVAASGVILIVLGLIPKLGEVFAVLPSPVLGGAGVALFGMIAASGIRTLSEVDWNETRTLIVGVSVAIALMPTIKEDFYDAMPEAVGMILHSGITTGAISVIVLNLLLNKGGRVTEDPLEAADDSTAAPVLG